MGFEQVCFYVAKEWLRLHWQEKEQQRIALLEASSDSTDDRIEDDWTAFCRSMVDLKMGNLKFRSWYQSSRAYLEDQLKAEIAELEGRRSSHSSNASQIIEFDPTMSEYAACREQYETAMDQALEEASLYTDILELHNTKRALRAANLSIEEAHSAGRITQLAYIFLPLTFVTGVFGMNITPFNDGAPMWKFWVTTWLILLPAWGFGLWTARTQIHDFVEERGSIGKAKGRKLAAKDMMVKFKGTASKLKSTSGVAKNAMV